MANEGAPILAFPQQNFPIVDEDGRVTVPWSRFFQFLFELAGGSIIPIQNPVVIRLIGVDRLGAYDATTGELLGTIPLENQPGGPVQVIPISGTPQIYKSVSDGTLVVFAAQVELSRDAGVTWYRVTLQGGAIPLKATDWARMTWYGTDPPEITWFPNYDL